MLAAVHLRSPALVTVCRVSVPICCEVSAEHHAEAATSVPVGCRFTLAAMKRLFKRRDGDVPSGPPFDEVADALDAAGLWEHLSQEDRSRRKADVGAGGWPLDDLPNWWFADGEDLAEGGVEDWLRTMADALQTESVTLVVETLHGPDDASGYAVRINGAPVEIYPRGGATATSWEDATLRPLATVNKLLAEARSRKRFGVLYAGGNEGIAHLQPAEVWEVLQTKPAWGTKARPTVP